MASISNTGRRLRMIKEVEVDPDGSLTRRWGVRADDVRVTRTMAALEANGITVLRASDAAAAKRMVLDLIPDASPVHQGASPTLDVLGITYEIEKSGRYAALRPRISSMDRRTEGHEIRRLGAAPDVMLGSVHAVTETGSLLAASMSGSQLGPYASGAGRGLFVDVVAVTVKAPRHRELVSAAIAAGKAVYCEWPLGRDLDDARAMAALAAKQGGHTVVGLQARQAPAIEFVQQLLRDGYVGEVLSTTMVGLSIPGDVVGQPNAYMLDKTNGANLLTVPVGHSLDLLNYVLGEFAELSAVSDLRRPLITIEETRVQIVKTAADQIAVIGTLRSGATTSVHIR